MLADYVLYAVLALLVAALLWIKRQVRAKHRLNRRKLAGSPAGDTLMSTIMRVTPASSRKEMRSDQAWSGGKVVDTTELAPDNWVRAPNSITGVRQDAD
jgi:hypothetical protein